MLEPFDTLGSSPGLSMHRLSHCDLRVQAERAAQKQTNQKKKKGGVGYVYVTLRDKKEFSRA